MRGKLADAMEYRAFVLVAAVCVMLFFILFVLPQFSSVLQDFGGKSDSALSVFIKLSDFLRANATPVLLACAGAVGLIWWLLRRPGAGAAVVHRVSRVPRVSRTFRFFPASPSFRNLRRLLGRRCHLRP